ncbi:MAG: cyclase family protein [Chloroflexota bacterium]
MLKFYDVSIPIKPGMIVYPGDPEPQIRSYASIPMNETNLSLICFGSHTGSHVDAQKHIRNESAGSAALSFDGLFGRCKVLDLTHVEGEIHCTDLEECSIKRGDIILLKTLNSLRGYEKFRKDYIYIEKDAAEYLVTLGVKTLGFDYISVEKFGSDLTVHQILLNNLTLFEGLDLSEVPAGEYTFVGLPLPIDCDGAPARVILVDQHMA